MHHFAKIVLGLICILTTFGINITSALDFRHEGNGGNCAGCRWISASGVLELGDAEKFENFINSPDWKGVIIPERDNYLVMFNSPGGKISAGMELGRIIRKLGFAVGIGKTTRSNVGLSLIDEGDCISACAYAFLGGKYRYTKNGDSCLGFHQFFDGSHMGLTAKEAATNAQLRSQIISGIVVEYLVDIDVTVEVYTFASRFTGSEYGCIQNNKRLRRKIDNSLAKFSPAQLVTKGNGIAVEVRSEEDGRIIQLYCITGDRSVIDYILPGNKVESFQHMVTSPHDLNGFKLNAGANSVIPKIIKVEFHPGIQNTTVHLTVDIEFIKDAIKTGEIKVTSNFSGYVEKARFGSFNFIVSGNENMGQLISRNCVN